MSLALPRSLRLVRCPCACCSAVVAQETALEPYARDVGVSLLAGRPLQRPPTLDEVIADLGRQADAAFTQSPAEDAAGGW